MSKMMLRSNGRPPLARSPIRLRSRRPALQTSANNTIQTHPGSPIKSQTPNRSVDMDMDKSELRPEYHTISCELRDLAKMVHQELGNKDDNRFDSGIVGAPLFERGKFYDEYSVRRNERLKRKKGEMEGYEKKTGYDLGVRADSAKKREVRKLDSRRKTVAAAATPVKVVVAQTPRYSSRRTTVSKENKKPPLPMAMMSVDRRSVRKK